MSVSGALTEPLNSNMFFIFLRKTRERRAVSPHARPALVLSRLFGICCVCSRSKRSQTLR